jgi:hypothetical protein
MKIEKIKSCVEKLEKMFGDDEIVDIEMNRFVIKVGVAWDVFATHLKATDRPECYGKLDRQNNQLVLSFRCDEGFILVTRIPV